MPWALSGNTQFVKNHDFVVLKNLVLQQEFRLRLNNKYRNIYKKMYRISYGNYIFLACFLICNI